MANTTTANLGLPLITDTTTKFKRFRGEVCGNNAGTTAEPLSMAQIIDAWSATVKKKPTAETFTVSSWSALSGKAPYTYSAVVTAATPIAADTQVELINNDAVAFSTYGFAIGAVSGQSITIYSVGSPAANVVLRVEIGG